MNREKQASQRQLRVGEEIRHALSRILARRDFRDPYLAAANLTVTEVRVSPDLKNATAFVVPLGGEGVDAVADALNKAKSYLRGQLGREVSLRYTPQITFKGDFSFDEATHINSLLKRPNVRRDLASAKNDETDQNHN
ncbi:MAG: 30S ribosome-binding factor RbfA [Kiloniellales bacterium]|nr:30S ribosome-binding factor RbfA [Kiloniellales bacterium]